MGRCIDDENLLTGETDLLSDVYVEKIKHINKTSARSDTVSGERAPALMWMTGRRAAETVTRAVWDLEL